MFQITEYTFMVGCFDMGLSLLSKEYANLEIRLKAKNIIRNNIVN
jgi:hypothetical protein